MVLPAPAILALGRPAASGRRTWTVVAAAAVVYLRVVAGAMVVAVVVVTVVVKSLGIQSETQQNAGRTRCFATLSGGRGSRWGFWGEMAAGRHGPTLLHAQKPKSPLLSPLQAPGLPLRARKRCTERKVHGPFLPGKSSGLGLSAGDRMDRAGHSLRSTRTVGSVTWPRCSTAACHGLRKRGAILPPLWPS